MTQLHAKISSADLQVLQDLLESCPSLKSLVLVMVSSSPSYFVLEFASYIFFFVIVIVSAGTEWFYQEEGGG